VLREPDPLVLLRRALVLRGDFAVAVERLAAALLPEDADPVDFARLELDFFAALARDAVGRDAVARDEPERAPLDLARDELLRPLVDLRVLPDLAPPPVPTTDSTSADHLPDMIRCAASATASAISDPSFVALEATLLAACCALSAASSPASRIARRAFGLALIAAAAAAKPAASISLLIAALASLSTVLLPELELEPERDDVDDLGFDVEELFLVDFAIASLPPGERHFRAVTVPE
jgi:hypothetical protein